MIVFFRKYFMIFVLCIATFCPAIGQGSSLQYGSPFIRNYSTDEYMGTDQVWAIGQDHRGVMYFGHGKGLLEFDGDKWRNYPVSNGSVVRSLDIDSDGLVYVGANNDFGYFKPNASGRLTYHSLHNKLPKSVGDYASVWKTFVTSNGVYYIGREHIFRWYNNSLDYIPVDLHAMFAFLVDDDIYIKDNQRGVLKIEGIDLVALSNCNELNNYTDGYFEMISLGNGLLLMVMGDKGFYQYDLKSQQLNKLTFSPFVEEYIKQNLGFRITKISDTEWAFCSIRGGILIFDKAGEVIRIINESRGLATDFVYDIYLDDSKNLWAATQFGISHVDLSNPLVKYTKEQGISDYLVCFQRHNGVQYFGTSINTYYLPDYKPSLQDDNHRVIPVEGLSDCWDLLDVKGHLIACHWRGLSEIIDDVSTSIFTDKRVFTALYDDSYHSNILFLGQIDGVLVAQVRENALTEQLEVKDTFKIKGFTGQVRSMVYDDSGNLWIGTYNSGLAFIRFHNGVEDYTVTCFTNKNGLPNVYNEASVNCLDGRVNAFTHKGIYKPVFPEKGQPDSLIYFEQDTRWGTRYTVDSTAALLAAKISDNKYFLFGEHSGIIDFNKDPDNVLHAPFVRLLDAYTLDVEEERYIQFGTSDAFYIYDTKGEKNYDEAYHVLIRQVRLANDSILFDGAFYNDELNMVSHEQPVNSLLVLDHANNALKINFSATFYEESEHIIYQYYIDGFDKGWNTWSSESLATYTNIPAGKYTFKVRARNIYGATSDVTTYRFRILPAWYDTWWAYIGYFFIGMFMVWLFVNLYTIGLKRKNKLLEKRVRNRTIELEKAISLLEDQKLTLKEHQKTVLHHNEALSLKQAKLEDTIQKLKAAQAQLVQTEKMASLGVLTAGVAHEINNPLNYIMGGYQGLKSYFDEQDLGDNSDIPVLLSSISTGIDRAAKIVRGLNQFSRDNERYNEECDIHSIIDNCLVMTHSELNEGVVVRKKYNPTQVYVLGNVGKLHQVFINLIGNANDAIVGEGQITIATEVYDNEIEIGILDTGFGIPKEHIGKVADPFFTTKEVGEGTGLGLSIVYTIVRDHNGLIEIESEEGKGTTVKLLLPLKI